MFDHSQCEHSATRAAVRACEIAANLPPSIEREHLNREARRRAQMDDISRRVTDDAYVLACWAADQTAARPSRWE